MSLRRSGFLALASFLAAGCPSVSQREPAQTVYLAAFSPTDHIIPTPNDLALFGAPGVTDPTTRGGLFALINLGGWLPNQPIAIPIRTLKYDAATAQYVPAAPPTGIEATSVNATTVAIVRTSDSPPSVLTPGYLTYVPDANPALGDLVIGVISGGAPVNLTPGHYTIGVRGGPAGVKASDGVPIDQDLIPALLAANKVLTNPENQPPGGIPAAEAAQLEQIRQTLNAGTVWGVPPAPNADTRAQICATALGIPIAAIPVALPEKTCWLPLTATAAITDAYKAIDLVFPHQEAVVLMTFTIVAPPSPPAAAAVP